MTINRQICYEFSAMLQYCHRLALRRRQLHELAPISTEAEEERDHAMRFINISGCRRTG